MGYALLWIESLALGLLLVATSLAALLRTRLPWGAILCSVAAVMLVPLGLFGVILSGAAWLRFNQGIVTGLYVPSLALLGCFLVGALGLMFCGLRRRDETVAAANWSLGKCSVALLVSLILVPMTYWNLDLAVSQRLATVRVEAGALALAVAPPRLPEKENAALVYGRVFKTWNNQEDWPEVWEQAVDALSDDEQSEFDFQSPELVDFLAERSAELTLLRQATALSDCRFDRDFGRPRIDMLLPEVMDLRTAARLLSVEAHHLASKGQTAKALENVQAMFNMAGHTASEPILVSVLVGIAIDGMAINTLQAVLPAERVDPEDLGSLDLDSHTTYQSRVNRSFRMEEAMALWIFSEFGHEIDSSELMGLLAPVSSGSSDSGSFPGFPHIYRVFLLEQDLGIYRETIGRVGNLSSSPFHETRQQWEDLENSFTKERQGLITSMLLPALSKCVEAGVRGDAQHRTAQVAWAMHRYRAEHGEFPEKLNDLVPDTLLMLPTDPYDGKPIKLKATDDGWIIYSIGPDMQDDGGAPMDAKLENGDFVFSYHVGE